MSKAYREARVAGIGTIWRYDPPYKYDAVVGLIARSGRHILSARQLARARMMLPLEHSLNTTGSVVREGIAYDADDSAILVSDQFDVMWYLPRGPPQGQLHASTSLRYKIPAEYHETLRTKTASSRPLMRFLFEEEAGRYSRFVAKHGALTLSIWCRSTRKCPNAFPIWIGPYCEDIVLGYPGFNAFTPVRAVEKK